MNAVSIILSTLLTVLLPIPAVFINFIFFLLAKKHKMYYGVLLAVSLAIIAYTWNPDPAMDLYRWHLVGQDFQSEGFAGLLSRIQQDFDPITYIFIYIVSLIGDLDLMQFFTTLLSFLALCWMLSDYVRNNNISTRSFAFIGLLAFMALRLVYVISGLWFYLAIISFALGVYLESQKQTRKLHWIFYAIATLTHVGTIILWVPLIFSRLIKKPIKITYSLIVIMIAISLVGPILSFLQSFLNLSIIDSIFKMYSAYFVKNGGIDIEHIGWMLIINMLEMLTCSAILVHQNGRGSVKMYNFKLLTALLLFTILFNAGVFSRYGVFIVILTIPDLMNFCNSAIKKGQLPYLIAISCCIILTSTSQYLGIMGDGVFESAEQYSARNIVSIIGEK